MTPEVHRRRPDTAAPVRVITAVAVTAAFAAGGVLTQTVIVPMWRAMDPVVFQSAFRTSGPDTGATLFPIELASAVLLASLAYPALRDRAPGRRAWLGATCCVVATLLLLPIYFVGANLDLLDAALPPAAVPGRLAGWYAWNWLRTGLSIAAAVLAGYAAVAGPADSTP